MYGDHAISEVLLDGEWHKVDSYTVDAPLFAAGQARLAAEGGTMGWGVHKDGINDWDGRSHSFVQYIMPAGRPQDMQRSTPCSTRAGSHKLRWSITACANLPRSASWRCGLLDRGCVVGVQPTSTFHQLAILDAVVPA